MENRYDKDKFQLIELSYLQKISRGDLAYEEKVTKLFIELVPENLAELQESYQLKDYIALKRTLHQLQSSISIMGLNEKLDPYLEMDFFGDVNEILVKKNIDLIDEICMDAIEEAKAYLIEMK